MIKKVYLLIIIGVMLLGLGLLLYSIVIFNVALLIIGIMIFLFGVLGMTLLYGYSLFGKVEDVQETINKNNNLHLAICSECGRKNILEDIYCIKCGNALGDKNGAII
ncbi:MAG: hypothetical protein QM489_05095 [Candidatus Izemoplasma sp.]